MIKVRLQGLPEEIEMVAEELDKYFNVHEISEPYKNRGKSEYVRVYAELSIKDKKYQKLKLNHE